MIGRVISGRYVVQAAVGSGGMAIVYRAFDKKTNRVVAIKVLRPEFESDEDFVRRFSREAEAASKVSHENIVNMLDVGIDGNLRYLVMEFVDGQTLKDLIRQRGAIHPNTAIRMTIRILAAVDHAHRNGIVHRDIKPQNILVDNQGRVKVADFGIARLKAEQHTHVEETSSASALGSVHYFSPEQAQGEVADEKSDLYSVGVVMYEMLTGRVPFEGQNFYAIALKHINEQPRSMREIQPDISPALDEVVMRALCKDPAKRYQRAADMAADLRKAISHPKGGFVVYPKTDEEKAQEKEDRRRRHERDRRRMKRMLIAVAVTGLVLLLATGFGYFAYMRDTYTMPSVVGQEQMLAQDTLDQVGAAVAFDYNYSEEYEEGIVIAQSRRSGARARRGEEVTLTVSRGSRYYYLEDFVGRDADEAQQALTAQGVESVKIEYTASDLPVDSVTATQPQPGMREKDAPVTLTVSGRRVVMPQLSGLSLENARALIAAEGLVVGEVTEGYAADATSGSVIGQGVPVNSQVLEGTVVNLTVNAAQSAVYYPVSKFSVVVPLNGSHVVLTLTTPSGKSSEVYRGTLNAGTYRLALQSDEKGTHTVDITMDDVLMERQTILFE